MGIVVGEDPLDGLLAFVSSRRERQRLLLVVKTTADVGVCMLARILGRATYKQVFHARIIGFLWLSLRTLGAGHTVLGGIWTFLPGDILRMLQFLMRMRLSWVIRLDIRRRSRRRRTRVHLFG